MMFNILTITLAIACLNFVPSYGAKDCSIRVRGDMSIPTPLILDPETYQMVIPNKRSNVIVGAGQSVKLWCSDSFTDSNKNLLTAKCISGIKFNIDGQSKNFNSLTCKSWQTVSAEPARKNCTDGEILDLGFRIDSHHFAKQMEICFDPLQEVTHYVQYRLGPYSKYYQTKVDRPGFEQLDYFGNKNVDNLYTKKKQMATFKKTLNMDVSKVYYGGSNSFLARGHIAAKADFVYGATECGTFVFLNVAPQWQSINAGNWNDIEELVRELANKRGTHFTVYSGVHGVTTLANNKGKQIPLYLYVDKNNNGQIPVPMLYYRVIIEESSKLGVVLITLNNPHLTKAQIQNEYTLCKDISNELSYFDIKHKTDLSLGYSYACTVPDFLKTVHNLPEIDVRGLLA